MLSARSELWPEILKTKSFVLAIESAGFWIQAVRYPKALIAQSNAILSPIRRLLWL
jgi:hypothetical protein